MNQFMIKMLVLPFYRAHTGFFILLFLLAFGFIRNTEHLAIATFFSANTQLLLLLMLIWSIYYLRSIFFIRYWMQLSQNFYWMQQFILLPRVRQMSGFWIAQLMINLPIAFYGFFIAVQGINQGYWLNVALILFYSLVMVVLPAFYYRKVLFSVYPEARQSRLGAYISRKWRKPRWLWFLSYLLKFKPLLLLFTKLLSLLLIIVVFNLYHTDTYDWRLLGIGVFVAFYFNGVLVYNKLQFDTVKMPGLLNLPVSSGRRSIQHLLEYVLLVIPEWIVMFRYWPGEESGWILLQLLIFGIFLLWMLQQYMWQTSFHLENLGAKDFFMFILISILLLFSVPVWVFILIFCFYNLRVNYRWYSLR